MSLIRHFFKFRFVFYYLICLWLAGFIRSLVLDLDRSLQVDKRIVERVLTEQMQKYGKSEDHSGAKHGIQLSSAAQAEVSSGEMSFRIQVGGAKESELSRLRGEYKKGGQRTDWLRANHTWFLWVHRCLPLILILHFVWYIRPASLVNRLIGKGVVVEDSLRFLGRARLLNLSRIAMLHGLILATLYGCVQFGAEYYLMPFPLDRYFLIPFSSLAYVLAFFGMVIGLFDPLILSLVPRYCKGHEIYQARTEAWFPGIAFRLRILVASAVIMPFTVLFLSQFVYNPLLRSAWSWIISEDHNPAVFAEMLPDLMNAGIAVFVLMVALIIGVTVGRGIFRSLAEPLESLAARMELVGSGDFTQRSSVLANDEIGRTKAHFNSMVEGLQHREFLKDTFGRFLSPSVSEQILKSGTIDLGGEEAMAAILFSDIRGFTAMSEKMTPSELVKFLNEYMAVVVSPIQMEKGVVNKFIGDAVLAMFGVPARLDSPCEQAFKAAIGMQKCLREWNRHRELLGLSPVNTGIGIHYGSVVAGNIGSPDRMEYTVIGDTVNIASRIESMTKSMDASILISDAVLSHLSDESRQGFRIVDCGEASLKGKACGVRLYSVQL